MRLRLGLVGLSRDWAHRHLPALRVLQDRFDVCGVFGCVPSRCETVAREFGARQYEGFHTMLADPSIDAAMILEDAWYGLAPIHAACRYGKAVYCGSDVFIDPADADDLRRTIGQSGIAFMAEFPRRYAPATLRLKELIATKLGRPRILFCHRRLPAHAATARSLRNGQASASPQRIVDREIMELIDWCSFVVGHPPSALQAFQHAAGGLATIATDGANTADEGATDAESDYVALSVDYSTTDLPRNSILAQISCGSYMSGQWHEAINYRPPAALQVCCENGLAFLDLPNSLVWFDEAGRHQESLDAEVGVGQQLLSMFHRSITSLVRRTCDLDDVYHALVALQAARQSNRQGCIVRVEH
ncbi:MAG: gfo/Idh/MocA family oxidoreductase [Planctomycetota bacterium]|nr:MAG: gfo/Idh/MocA family oxidoreductase [Planctomycetota bacterium]